MILMLTMIYPTGNGRFYIRLVQPRAHYGVPAVVTEQLVITTIINGTIIHPTGYVHRIPLPILRMVRIVGAKLPVGHRQMVTNNRWYPIGLSPARSAQRPGARRVARATAATTSRATPRSARVCLVRSSPVAMGHPHVNRIHITSHT